ncbi:MAG: nitrogen regulatory protein [Micavibrio sp.]|nr:MAG: nitrogen regulatory protein [Micavibrio sp.]
MRNFVKDIRIDLIIPNMKVNNRRQALEALTEKAAPVCSISKPELLDHLISREETANSGIGDGVAIPHIKFRQLDKPFIALARLDEAVAFDSIDGEPVSLICMVLSPEQEGPLYLQRLSRISRLLRRKELRQQLLNAKDAKAMCTAVESALTDWAVAA